MMCSPPGSLAMRSLKSGSSVFGIDHRCNSASVQGYQASRVFPNMPSTISGESTVEQVHCLFLCHSTA